MTRLVARGAAALLVLVALAAAGAGSVAAADPETDRLGDADPRIASMAELVATGESVEAHPDYDAARAEYCGDLFLLVWEDGSAACQTGMDPQTWEPVKPVLGATVEGTVYADEDRTVSVLNRSSVKAVFTVETEGRGWQIAPAHRTLAPGEQADFQIAQVGDEPGKANVRVVAKAKPAPGTQQGELVLGTRLLLESPVDFRPFVVGSLGLALVLGVGAAVGFRRLRGATVPA